jgi:hypothetical protein
MTPHVRIEAAFGKQELMRAALGNDALVEDDDLVGVNDG